MRKAGVKAATFLKGLPLWFELGGPPPYHSKINKMCALLCINNFFHSLLHNINQLYFPRPTQTVCYLLLFFFLSFFLPLFILPNISSCSPPSTSVLPRIQPMRDAAFTTCAWGLRRLARCLRVEGFDPAKSPGTFATLQIVHLVSTTRSNVVSYEFTFDQYQTHIFVENKKRKGSGGGVNLLDTVIPDCRKWTTVSEFFFFGDL